MEDVVGLASLGMTLYPVTYSEGLSKTYTQYFVFPP